MNREIITALVLALTLTTPLLALDRYSLIPCGSKLRERRNTRIRERNARAQVAFELRENRQRSRESLMENRMRSLLKKHELEKRENITRTALYHSEKKEALLLVITHAAMELMLKDWHELQEHEAILRTILATMEQNHRQVLENMCMYQIEAMRKLIKDESSERAHIKFNEACDHNDLAYRLHATPDRLRARKKRLGTLLSRTGTATNTS